MNRVRVLIFGFTLFILSCYKKDQTDNPKSNPSLPGSAVLKDYYKNITIVNWNIEWFGDATYFKGNPHVQETNAGKILKYLDADLYGLCEIVDTARLGRIVRNSLGNDYQYVVSFFTSGKQKLAFVYNKNIFRNVSVRPFMGVSTTAYFNFGNRYPYLLNADVYVNGTHQNVNFILIHAKANADIESYNRRLAGAIEMKDSLDTYFSEKKYMIIGDYNDNLDKSIVNSKATPYQNFLLDKVRYNAITLPLNVPGRQSSLGYANSVIDQQIISTSMQQWYISHSAQIRTDVVNAVADFKTGNTSDHYPVSSVYYIVQ